jgi:hypothetical protein
METNPSGGMSMEKILDGITGPPWCDFIVGFKALQYIRTEILK